MIGAHIFLRTVNPSDFNILFTWENNPDNWEVSNTFEPFTKEEINDFVNLAPDVYEHQQIRYIICLKDTKESIGCIDLFEFDDQNKRVGVGILIAEIAYRNKGFAKEALELLLNYCQHELKVKQIFCNIFKENKISIRLFESCGFKFIDERMLDGNKVNYYEFLVY